MNQTRLYNNIYEKLYRYYKERGEAKLALYVKKVFIVCIEDKKTLLEELGIVSDRTLRQRKKMVNKDLLTLARTSKDVRIPAELLNQ